MKRPLLALFLSIVLALPAQGTKAANFVEPMVMTWQMMDAMRQMMAWFGVGSYRNNYTNQWLPLGSLYPTPYGSDLNSLNLLGLNHYPSRPYQQGWGGPLQHNLVAPEMALAEAMESDGEWLRDPLPDEENFWGDGSRREGAAVPLRERYPGGRSGYPGVDGIWLVKTGERWLIQGNRFALVSASGIVTSGEFRIRDGWIGIRHYVSNRTILLQFRQMGDLLIIRDRSGEVAQLHRVAQPRTPFNYGGYIR